jgi:hypothetical protein
MMRRIGGRALPDFSVLEHYKRIFRRVACLLDNAISDVLPVLLDGSSRGIGVSSI